MGNLRSVAKALELSGEKVLVSRSPEDILKADSIILPGVGAFSSGMKNLEKFGLIPFIIKALEKGKPFLGICLGMQLLFEKSEEGSECPGLGVLKGTVKRFPQGLRVPHVGWNSVHFSKTGGLFKGIPDKSYFYFVHSYYTEPDDKNIIASKTSYGFDFVSSVRKDNIYLTQFHPEKSHKTGLKLLENFCKF
jgi:imidazole glycerol-phosphate synthase subunit HisH